MSVDLNNKYVRKDVLDQRMDNVILRFDRVDERLDNIEEAIKEQKVRSWQNGWKLIILIVGAVGGIQGIIKLLEHLPKP